MDVAIKRIQGARESLIIQRLNTRNDTRESNLKLSIARCIAKLSPFVPSHGRYKRTTTFEAILMSTLYGTL